MKWSFVALSGALLSGAMSCAPVAAEAAVQRRTPAAPAARPAPAPSVGSVAPAASVAPLTLAEVLRSSARAAPQIVEQLARVRQAEGRALTADGAFDTVFDVEARSRVTGFYDGSVVEGRATRPFTGNGGYAYGNYRISRGDFPIYEDRAYTNRAGQPKIGALYALLRDRLIDARRAGQQLAAADIEVARFEAGAVAIGVQQRAIDAYQTWVAAGLRLRAYRDLVALAEARRGGIVRLVQLGARPEVLVTENDQNLVRRRALVVQAEGDFIAATNAMSLYLRDAAGAPLTVGAERLPADAGALAGPAVTVRQEDVALRRPELRTLLARIDQSLLRLALAENERKPRLDASGEAGKGLGAIGLGGRSRSPLETIVGLRLSVPLQNRAARGRVDEARAEIAGLEARNRFLRDQIAVQVEGIAIALSAAERLSVIAEQERVLAERLAQAERRRFTLGSSDFFLVNQREETANDASVRLIDAQARIAAARASLAAATADRAALGLE